MSRHDLDRQRGRPHQPGSVRHQAIRKRRQLQPERIQLNLTSLIDVIFLLLIYFVVTAQFVQDEGVLTCRMPGGREAQDSALRLPMHPLRIVLVPVNDTQCGIRVNQESFASFTELSQRLSSWRYDPVDNPDGVYESDNPIVIKPEGFVRWQYVVNAFNAAIGSRYTNVRFAAIE